MAHHGQLGRALVISALLLCSFSAAQAQAPAPLTPGARLRVTVAQPPGTTIGRYQDLTSTTLVLTTRAIPVSDITRLEQSAGRRPNVATGIAGLLLGAAVGGALGCAANRDSYGVFCGGQSDTKVAVGAVLGGLAGGVIGAYAFRRERWQSVDLRVLQQP